MAHEHGLPGELTEQGGLPIRRMGPLALALAITSLVLTLEVAGGLITGSLALLADAGHMASDVGALVMALCAVWIARRAHTSRRTYGYLRVEVLAALANGVLLWAVAAYIFWEAATRFSDLPDVRSGPMIGIASVGLIANLTSAVLLARGSRDNINIMGALYHVVSDALGSLGAILAGVLMLTLGWRIMDPIISVGIGVLVLAGSTRLIRDAVNVLMEGSPAHIDPAELQRAIEGFPLAEGVHDIHTWTITSGYHAMSAHVMLKSKCTQARAQALLDDLRHLAGDRFGIAHVTIQLEGGDAECREAHLPPVPAGPGAHRIV